MENMDEHWPALSKPSEESAQDDDVGNKIMTCLQKSR